MHMGIEQEQLSRYTKVEWQLHSAAPRWLLRIHFLGIALCSTSGLSCSAGVCPNVGRCRCAHEFEPDQLDLLREYYQLLARAEAARRQQQQQTGN